MRLSSQLLLTFLLNAFWQVALIATISLQSAHGCCETPSHVTGTGFGPLLFVSRF